MNTRVYSDRYKCTHCGAEWGYSRMCESSFNSKLKEDECPQCGRTMPRVFRGWIWMVPEEDLETARRQGYECGYAQGYVDGSTGADMNMEEQE